MVAVLAGCGADDALDSTPDPTPDPTNDRSDEVFAADRLLRVDIELDPADWDELRFQERTELELLAGECMAEPFEKPYTFFSATVAIDGEVLEDIGVRKKGFLGSLSETKPSLKLDFAEFVPGQRYMGMKRMTLNNAVQDPSFVNQCIGYDRFRAAGVPAPRCNFAEVTVNGEPLGVYVHVEGVKKPFLRRHFASDEGNLYEGTLSDFRPEWQGTFERKTNETDPPGGEDRGDIDALVALIMDTPDAALEDALAAAPGGIDLDEFLSFWAMEVIVAHWDGYAANTNNFFIYNDPTTGLWSFIPWGADALLDDHNPFGSPASATGVFATGILARRLYDLPATRAAYADRVRELLDTVWDEAEILAEIDRMHDLIAEAVPADQAVAFEDALADARAFVSGRRDALLAVLEPTPPPFDEPLRDPFCLDQIGTARITFQTTWQTSDPFATPATFDVVVDGERIEPSPTGAIAGPDEDDSSRAVIAPIGVLADGSTLLAFLGLDLGDVAPGTLAVDREVVGYLLRFPPNNQPVEFLGMLGDGALTLDEAATTPGGAIAGTLEVAIYESLF